MENYKPPKPPKLKRCPECSKITGATKIWGMPIGEAFEWEKQGLVVLMGCEPGSPVDEPPYKFQCTNCGHQWGGIPFKDLPDKDEMLKVVDEFIKDHGHDCFMKLLSRCGKKRNCTRVFETVVLRPVASATSSNG